ncbi:MAG: PQQ-dependent sugar dehydrogenase, partial [Mycobacteriaceae bacterium]
MVNVFDAESGKQRSTFVDISGEVNSTGDRGLMSIVLHPDFGDPTGEHNYLYAYYVADPADSADTEDPLAGPDGTGDRFAYVVRFTADPETKYTTAIPDSEVILLGGVGVSGTEGLKPRTSKDISGGGAVDSTFDLKQPESGFDPEKGSYVDNYLKVDSQGNVGGSLAFGPDGALYVATGDGASSIATDPRAISAQSIDSLSGKILRIDPITGSGLKDNPFAKEVDLETNRAKVYELGLRNPSSIGFAEDGRLFVTDVNWFSWEKVGAAAGANFGWPYFTPGDKGVLQPTPELEKFFGGEARNGLTVEEFYHAVANGDIKLTEPIATFTTVDLQGVAASSCGSKCAERYPGFENWVFFSEYGTAEQTSSELFNIDGDPAAGAGAVFAVDSRDPNSVRYLYSGRDWPVQSFVQGKDGHLFALNNSGGISKLLIEPTDQAGEAEAEAEAAAQAAAQAEAAQAQAAQALAQAHLTSYKGLTTAGDTRVSDGVFTLTTAGGRSGQLGTAMSGQRIDLSKDFIVAFEVNLGANDAGADGATIVFHNDPRGVGAMGRPGGALGATGIGNGLAIEFDTYANISNNPQPNADIAADHTSFVGTDSAFGTTAVALPNIENGAWHSVVVNWNAAAQTLSYTFDNQPGGVLNSDLSTQFSGFNATFGGSQYAYFGFTASTGAFSNTQSIRNVRTNATFENLPELTPYEGLRAGGDARVSDDVVTLTTAGGRSGQLGTAMSGKRLDVSRDFTVAFEVNLGANDAGADGATIVFHNDPRGVGAMGRPGGALGATGIGNGLAIEFDTYANISNNPQPNADIVADHTSFVGTDSAFGTTAVALPNIENGAWHSVVVTWNAAAQTMSYTFDNQSGGVLNSDIATQFFGGSQYAYFGFTASTGAFSNTQSIRNVRTNATFENLPELTPYEGLRTGGDTRSSDGVVALTTAGGRFDQVGMAMSSKRLDVSRDFIVAFEANFGADDAGADGAAIVFHNDLRGVGATGRAGGALGASGIRNGLAIEFDTYANLPDNPFQPNADIAADHTS